MSLFLAPRALNIPISFLAYDIDVPMKFENSKMANNTKIKLTTNMYLYSALYVPMTVDISDSCGIL